MVWIAGDELQACLIADHPSYLRHYCTERLDQEAHALPDDDVEISRNSASAIGDIGDAGLGRSTGLGRDRRQGFYRVARFSL